LKATDIIALARQDFLDDNVETYLWSNSTLLRYLNEAEAEEACVRAELIEDRDTVSDANDLPVCRISLVAGQSEYRVSSYLRRILRLKITTEVNPIEPTTESWLDRFYSGWEAATGTPRFVFIRKGRVVFVPAPEESATVQMVVYRKPLNEMRITSISVVGSSNISFDAATGIITMPTGNFISAGLRPGNELTVTGTAGNNGTLTASVVNKTAIAVNEDLVDEDDVSATITSDSIPEVGSEFHVKLIDWLCHMAYLKQDADTRDMQKVNMYEQNFEKTFGPRPSARALGLRLTKPRNAKVWGREFGF
jgi:hypothetical protein